MATRRWYSPSIENQVEYRYHIRAMADVKCSCGQAYSIKDLLRRDHRLVQIQRWFILPDPMHWCSMPIVVSYSQYRHMVDRGVVG